RISADCPNLDKLPNFVRSLTIRSAGTITSSLCPGLRQGCMARTQKDLHKQYKGCIWGLAWDIDNTAHRLGRCRASICATVGLSPERWSALANIHRSTYVLSISDLARQLRRPRQSAHSLAVGIERDGLIRFLPNPDDRRLLQIE